jgi:hypothetical protein
MKTSGFESVLIICVSWAATACGGDEGRPNVDAGDFCRELNQIICESAQACDPEFPGTVEDCVDYLNQDCIGIADYKCGNARKHSGACLDGVAGWTCNEFMDDNVTMDDIEACAAMETPCASGGGGGGGSSCDCSHVSQTCTYTYDSSGNATPHCTCSPSCCC